MSDWYNMEASAVVAEFKTNIETGLSNAEAQRRLQEYGPNELIDRGIKSIWSILWDQIREIMVVILIISAVVSALLGESNDAIVILLIVILNTILGFSQEYRAEQAIAALKKLAVPNVRVLRDGQVQEISARELVPGDIAVLEAGNLVPADGRVVQSVNLRIEEAALTGESHPVDKKPDVIKQHKVPMGDRMNMVFMGTVITYGRGNVLITETGMKTELGNLANLIQTVEREPTPLQRRLERLGKTLAEIAVAIIAIVIVLGLFRGEDLRVLFLTGISMAVAVVPEGLPAVVTITLALGAQRMLKRNALVRKLPAVETLGSVTVVCSDKTGTLTENRMTVTVLDVANEEPLQVEALIQERPLVLHAEFYSHIQPPRRTIGLMVKAMALCNDAVLSTNPADGTRQIIGDPTEGALIVAAAELGVDKGKLEQEWRRVAEVPFTSERKRMTTVHTTSQPKSAEQAPWGDAPYVAFSKGAVDSLLEICDSVWMGDHAVPLDQQNMRERIQEANIKKARQGQRVLGVSYRPVAELPDPENEEEMQLLESGQIFLGVIGMLDPPRAEVKEAVRKAKSAGIRPIMITGDHPLTAQHIAHELGMSDKGDAFLTGNDLAHMSLAELEARVEEVSVYARVSPEHKLNIVQALQDKGHITAMTGDGVNDAPALKKADIGVAMGITGTDVSKEAADMILLDDNFATIVAAIEEGRVIFDNIRKFIKYTLSSNTGEMIVMLVGPFLGMPLALTALQILWINLVTDGLPGLALAVEPAERGIMKRGPFHPRESIFSRGLGRQILWVGSLMGLVSLGVGYIYWLRDPNGPWQTMVFTTLTLSQMGNALAIRSNTDSIFTIGWLSNKAAIGSVLLTFALQIVVTYVAFFQGLLEIEALRLNDLLIALGLSTIVFTAVEIEKWWRRRQGQTA
ncbi:MAG: cation-translocating P-type ATPase [Candidatus Promineifilaceae bacterium]